MDGDGQNDPADIPKLADKLAEGYDLVVGWRIARKDPLLSRRVPSMIANRLISWSTNVQLHDYGCTMKAMRQDVAKGLKLYGEMHRFIPAIAYERGARVAELVVNHRPRLRGVSKYGITRTVRVKDQATGKVREEARVLNNGLARRYINKQVGRIKRMFSWAVEEGLVPAGGPPGAGARGRPA